MFFFVVMVMTVFASICQPSLLLEAMFTFIPYAVQVFPILAQGGSFISGVLIGSTTGLAIILVLLSWTYGTHFGFPKPKSADQDECNIATVDLNELISLLEPVKKWFRLGFHLGMELHTLTEIRGERKTDDEKRMDMLNMWMKSGTVKRTWTEVVRSLHEMEEHGLAKKIASKHGVVYPDMKHTDLNSVLELIWKELKEVTNWFLLGIYLGVPATKLKIIEKAHKNGDPEGCKLDMLIAWMNETNATDWWSSIVLALTEMNYETKARNIEKRYVKSDNTWLLTYAGTTTLVLFLLQYVTLFQTASFTYTIACQWAGPIERVLIVVVLLSFLHQLGWSQNVVYLAVKAYEQKHPQQANCQITKFHDPVLLYPNVPGGIPVRTLFHNLKELTNWMELGFHLDVPEDKLHEIYDRNEDVKDCLREMLAIWSQREFTSWKKIIFALTQMKMYRLAIRIANKYGIPYPDQLRSIVQREADCTMKEVEISDAQKNPKVKKDLEDGIKEKQQFCISDVRLDKLLVQLQDITVKWFQLGFYLKVPHAKLKEIEFKYKDDYEECKCRMLIVWCDLSPSLEKLIKALVNIEMFSVALKVAIKNCVPLPDHIVQRLKQVSPDQVRVLEVCTTARKCQKSTEACCFKDDLCELMNELREIIPCWLIFGIYLGIQQSRVLIIEANHKSGGCERCMLEVLMLWRNQESEPQWSKIVQVLIEMEKYTTAQKIAEKYGLPPVEPPGHKQTEQDYTIYKESTENDLARRVIEKQVKEIQKSEEVSMKKLREKDHEIHELTATKQLQEIKIQGKEQEIQELKTKLQQDKEQGKHELVRTRELQVMEMQEKEQEIFQLKTAIEMQEHKVLAIQKAEKCDICFVMDCTSSMDSWIVKLKDAIKTVCRLVKIMQHYLKLRIAFVGYRDFCDGAEHTSYLPFTNDVDEFCDFVGQIKATGGGDTAEDVFAGLKAMLECDWHEDAGTKVVLHIADAPCHGRLYHDDKVDDNQPEMDQDGSTAADLMCKVAAKNLQYYFGYCNKSTDKMIEVFNSKLPSGRKIELIDLSKSANTIMEGVLYSMIESIERTKGSLGLFVKKPCAEPDERPAQASSLQHTPWVSALSNLFYRQPLQSSDGNCNTQ